MSQWFYAESDRERRGPLASESLVELFRAGRIALDTLVWREGVNDWQPLGNFVEELGLIDLRESHSLGTAAAPAGPPPLHTVPPPPDVAAPLPIAKSGLSGCALVAIILAVVGVILIGIIAVLAAIAVPAYQQYTLRANAAATYLQLLPLKAEISAFVDEHERCPVNGDEAFGTPESYARDGISEIRIGFFEEGYCGLEARLDVPGKAQLNGKAIWLDYDIESNQWQCSAELDDDYLPLECRG